jgi:hypothetical protein
MTKLFRALFLLLLALAQAPQMAALQQPTATPGPTEVLATATRPPTVIIPTAKPPRPSYTPSATRTRTPSPTRTATATRTPTPTPAPIYELRPGNNWIEAEHPTNDTSSTWALKSDAAASNAHALIATTDNAGTLEYRFELDYAGTIAIWLRAIRAPDTTRPVRIRLDHRGDDPATVRSTSWAWSLDDDATYDIQPGLHTFSIQGEAGGVQIDALLITTDLDSAP